MTIRSANVRAGLKPARTFPIITMRYYDTIVIGGGHAGVEAALALSRMGCSTLMVTLFFDTIVSGILTRLRHQDRAYRSVIRAADY